MEYREHAPAPALAPWVACFWERAGDGAGPVRVVPDGCIDIVWTEGHGTHVVGPNTTAFLVSLAPGAGVAGVRLRPGAAPALLDVDALELRDGRAPLQTLWGDAGRRLAERLDAGAACGDAAAASREALVAALVARAHRAPAPDPLVSAVVRRLDERAIEVTALARELHVSERQLRRRVERAVGYGPKRLARVLRLGRALGAARAGGDLGRVAADAGYADQSHLANECRALAGAPPTLVLAAA